jgi:hypothetical protein
LKLKPEYRITVFVPPTDLERLLEHIVMITPLAYGLYDNVAWWSHPGTEQFRPLPGSHPARGFHHSIERGSAVKLEFSIPRDEELLDRVINEGIVPAHPWEEPVICVAETLSTRMKADESDPK